jgi:hypothetical protein
MTLLDPNPKEDDDARHDDSHSPTMLVLGWSHRRYHGFAALRSGREMAYETC